MAADIISLIYNILLSCTVCFAVACLYYHRLLGEDKNLCLALTIMFVAYIFDNTIVYATESIASFAEVYDKNFISNPNVKTVYFLILVGSMLFAFMRLMPIFTMKALLIIMTVYAAALICIPLIPQNDTMVFMYYLPTQLIISSVSLWGLIMLKKKKTHSAPEDVPLRRILVFTAIMGLIIFIEDSFVIFCLDIYSTMGLDSMGLKINNRNLSENILVIGLAVFIIGYTKKRLLLTTAEKKLAPAKDEQPVYEESPAANFCISLGFTDREREIFIMLLDGVSQQDISEELIIALGTVKTHVHNIYKKAGVSNRAQMQAKFQLFCEKTKQSANV